MPAQYAQSPSAAGTMLAVSTTAPASHDTPGFDGIAEASWNNIGFITSPGGVPRPARDFKDVQFLDGSSTKIPGPQTMESFDVTCMLVDTDEGQQVIQENDDGQTVVWLRWTYPSGRTRYCAAYVSGAGEAIDSPSDEVSFTFTVVPIFDVNGVGPVLGAA